MIIVQWTIIWRDFMSCRFVFIESRIQILKIKLNIWIGFRILYRRLKKLRRKWVKSKGITRIYRWKLKKIKGKKTILSKMSKRYWARYQDRFTLNINSSRQEGDRRLRAAIHPRILTLTKVFVKATKRSSSFGSWFRRSTLISSSGTRRSSSRDV